MSTTTQDPVPLVASLDAIYSSSRLLKEGKRWDDLTKRFASEYAGAKPDFVARAPGRVNIIGEHIDHMGFSVLPAALEMDILMAVKVHSSASSSSEDDKLSFELRNTVQRLEPAKFECSLADASQLQLLHEGGDRWANYFKVAFKGLHPHLPKSALSSSASRPSRIEVLVDGTIPPESSLSSSAAMTVCSSIVVLEALGARSSISRREMAEVAIESERLVGVASGGMDQAASIFGVPGHALHISFVPTLTAVPTLMPASKPEHTFLVANTLVVSDKKVMGPVQYNLRVAELKMAARALCVAFGLPKDASTATLRTLQDVYFAKYPLPAEGQDKSIDEVRKQLGDEAAMIKVLGAKAEEVLPKGELTRAQVEEVTGYAEDEFDKEFLSQFPIRADTFKLQARTRHVFAEAYRVHEFKYLCGVATSASSAAANAATTYERLGALMNASQESLMGDYENGCQELLDVVRIAREAGSLGSRATGAGWGGSTVHLVRSDKVEGILKALREQFYAKLTPALSEEQIDASLLVSQPAGGACIHKLD